MMMDVNFRGFRNAGIQVNDLYDTFGRPKTRMAIFNCELSDNYMGKDLSIFTPIFKKSSNPYNNKFLSFELWKCMEKDSPEFGDDVFIINQQRYDINMENLWIFGRIARLLKKITETPKYLFAVSKDWLESEDCNKSFILAPNTVDMEVLNSMHTPKNVKYIAESMLDELTGAVAEYLEC